MSGAGATANQSARQAHAWAPHARHRERGPSGRACRLVCEAALRRRGCVGDDAQKPRVGFSVSDWMVVEVHDSDVPVIN